MLTANLPYEVMCQFTNLVRDVDPEKDYFISVHTDDEDKALTPVPQNTLYVAFGDTVTPSGGLISQTQVQEIAKFILRVRAMRGNLWVNCWAGISRSGAIVDTLIKLGWRDLRCQWQERRVPNPVVEAKLLQQFTELRNVSPKYTEREWGNEIYTIFYSKKYGYNTGGQFDPNAAGAPSVVRVNAETGQITTE